MKKFVVALAALLLLSTQAFTAFADVTPIASVEGGSLTMSTEFPSRAVSAGDSVDFDLDFANQGASELAQLSVESAPEGWSADFIGDGDSVGSIYVKNGNTAGAAILRVRIPSDAATGMYEIVAKADGETASSTLTLKLGVQELEYGESNLVIEYGEQEGSSSSTFSFSTTIQNNTGDEQTYSLSAQVPNGWTAAITADSTQVSAVTIPAQSSQNLIVKITPAAGAEAEEYTIPFSATSARDSLNGEFKLTITGTYAMTLSTPSGRLSFDATANKQSAVTLSVTNTGNIALQNINLNSQAPTGWTVEYSESSIDTLEAGASKEITMYVTPAKDALSGDYATLISASNSQTSATASFRVTVKTETAWGIVGALIILAVLAVLGFCFKKFGRR